MEPLHPGEILDEEFLRPFGISRYRLTEEIGVPPRHIEVQGSRRISADSALRMARYFGTSERFFLNLQGHYDLETAKTGSDGRWKASSRSLAPAELSRRRCRS